jgi:hypothetical protein
MVTMTSLKKLEKEVETIKSRNRRVEADKAWERSYVRRFLIVIFTYLAIALYLNAIGVQHAWLNAVVPAVGFTLSTLTFPYFKKLWLEYKGISY